MLILIGGLVVAVVVVVAGVNVARSTPSPPRVTMPEVLKPKLTELGFEELDVSCWTRDENEDGSSHTLFYDAPEGTPLVHNLWYHDRRAVERLRTYREAHLYACPEGVDPPWDSDEQPQYAETIEPKVRVRVELEGAPVEPGLFADLATMLKPSTAALASLNRAYLELEFVITEEKQGWKLNLYWSEALPNTEQLVAGVALITSVAGALRSE